MQALAEILKVHPPRETNRRRGGYTMASNYLLDNVIPRVKNPVGKLILVKMERETTGYHQDVAAVSLADMMDFTGASKSTVKRVLKELIESGHLVVVEEGTGHRKTKYRLELHPEQDMSPDAHTREPTPASSRDALNVLPVVPEASDAREPGTFESLPPEGLLEPPSEAISSGSQCQQNVPVPEPPGGIDMTPQGVQGDPPFKGLKKEKENKTNKKTEAVSQLDQSQGPNEAMQAVCSTLRSFGVSVEPNNHAFIQWCCTKYGKEKILQKLDIFKLQTLRGCQFTNPLGWLRRALASDYQYSVTDTAKVKAEELTEQDRERSQRESDEQQKHRDRVSKERDDPEAQARIKAHLDEFWNGSGARNE